jgi:hypothetical protein
VTEVNVESKEFKFGICALLVLLPGKVGGYFSILNSVFFDSKQEMELSMHRVLSQLTAFRPACNAAYVHKNWLNFIMQVCYK